MTQSALVGALVVLLAVPAFADPQADPAVAEALFREGRTLLLDGKTDEACPKLATSFQLDPSSGTLINLALCHQTQGKTATAWAEYLKAATLARATNNPDRATEASDRAANLEPKVGYVRFSGLEGQPTNLTVVRDEEPPMPFEAMKVALPTNAGAHMLSFRADGYVKAEVPITAQDGQTLTVQVPSLTRVPMDQPPIRVVPPSLPQPTVKKPANLPPIVLAIGGGTALVVGAIFGGLALSTYAKANSLCPAHRDCSTDAIAKRSAADTQAWIADVALPVGVVALATAAVWLIVNAKWHPPRTDVAWGKLEMRW